MDNPNEQDNDLTLLTGTCSMLSCLGCLITAILVPMVAGLGLLILS